MERWEAVLLGEVLRVTYGDIKPWGIDMWDAESASDAPKPCHVSNEAFLDDLVIHCARRGGSSIGSTPFSFLLDSYRRIQAIQKSPSARLSVCRPAPSKDELQNAFGLIRKWIVTYICLILAIPGIVPAEAGEGDGERDAAMEHAKRTLLQRLAEVDRERQLGNGFMGEVARHLVLVNGDPDAKEGSVDVGRPNEVSIRGVLGDIIARLGAWMGGDVKDVEGVCPSFFVEGSMEPPLRAAISLASSRPVVAWLTRSRVWSHLPPIDEGEEDDIAGDEMVGWDALEHHSGRQLATRTWLGRAMALGGGDGSGEVLFRPIRRSEVDGEAGAPGMTWEEQCRRAIEKGDVAKAVALLPPHPQARRSGWDDEGSHHPLCAQVRVLREARQAQLQANIREHAGRVSDLFTTLASRSGLRQRIWAWVSAVLKTHVRRGGLHWTHFGSQDEASPFAPPLLLHTLASVMIRVCARRFLDPTSPHAAGIDLRILSSATPNGKGDGAGLFDSTDDARLNRDRAMQARHASTSSSLKEDNGEGGSEGEVVDDMHDDFRGQDAFVDRRNLARQRQYAARQARLAAQLAGEAAAGPADEAEFVDPLLYGKEEGEGEEEEVGGVGGRASGGGKGREEKEGAEEDESVIVEEPSGYAGISELFALTLRILHLGPQSTIERLRHLQTEIRRAKEQRERIRQHIGGGMVPPHVWVLFRQMDEAVEKLTAEKLELELGVQDAESAKERLQFYRLVAVTLLRGAIHPVALSKGNLRGAIPVDSDGALPLPTPRLPLPLPSPVFAGLSEHVAQDVADSIISLRASLSGREFLRLNPTLIAEQVDLCIVLLASPLHVSSPFVRHRFVEALHALLPAPGDRARTARMRSMTEPPIALERYLLESRTAMRSLGPALLRFFVDVEVTGAHTQFYDKFRYRAEVADLIALLFQSRPHRAAVQRYGKDPERCLQFVSFLLNDLNFCLEEIESRLTATTTAAADLRTLQAGGGSGEEVQEAMERLREAERSVSTAKYFSSLAESMLWLAVDIAAEAPAPFIAGETLPRVAMTATRFLWTLLGAGAEPLGGVASIPVSLASPTTLPSFFILLGRLLALLAPKAAKEAPIPVALARQDRFFDAETFNAAATSIAECEGLPPHLVAMASDAAKSWRDLAKEASAARDTLEEDDEDDDDAPDHFLDSLTYEVMRDPVRLPSNNVVDRATLRRQILENGEQDPFTREPLSEDDVVPVPELREEILAWRAEKKKTRLEQPVKVEKKVDEGAAGESGEGEGEEEDDELFTALAQSQLVGKPDE